MAARNFILNYWDNQLAVLADHISLVKKEITPAAIHDLRVTIKKLRSTLQLYYRVTRKKRWKEAISKTEILFKILGKHRELDINLQYMTKIDDDDTGAYKAIQNIYRNSLADAGSRLAKALAVYQPADLTAIGKDMKTNLADNSALFSSTLKSLFAADIKKIRKSILVIKQQPHETRKQLKTFYYWLEIFPPGYLLEQPAMKKLEQLLDQLGAWHDTDWLRLQLKELVSIFIPAGTSEFTGYKKLIRKLGKDNKKLLETIAEAAARWRKEC
jgi:CHAD domain-containing protein